MSSGLIHRLGRVERTSWGRSRSGVRPTSSQTSERLRRRCLTCGCQLWRLLLAEAQQGVVLQHLQPQEAQGGQIGPDQLQEVAAVLASAPLNGHDVNLTNANTRCMRKSRRFLLEVPAALLLAFTLL